MEFIVSELMIGEVLKAQKKRNSSPDPRISLYLPAWAILPPFITYINLSYYKKNQEIYDNKFT
jgi:hypothetical protein